MKSGRLFSGFLSLAVCAAFLPGCASGPVSDPTAFYRSLGNTKGTLKEGRYYSPDDNFSCALPELIDAGASVKDVSGRGERGRSGTVTFQNDLGLLLRVDWLEIPESEHPVAPDPAFDRSTEESYALLLFNQYKQVSPAASLVTHEFLSDPGEEKLFVTSLLPGGSTLVDKSTGRRLDAYRASLIFRQGGWVYCLSTQSTHLPKQAPAPLNSTLAQLKQTLQVFRGGFQFQ